MGNTDGYTIDKMTLNPPPIGKYKISSKPIYYKDLSNQKEYVIFLSHSTDVSKTRLIKYDIDDDSFEIDISLNLSC